MQLKNKTILIADDEPAIREFIRDELEFEGATVLEANNGGEAAAILKTRKVDVVVSDIRMPGGDGIQLLKEIKEGDVHAPIVMFMTGFSDLPIQAAYEMGADAVYAKPFSLSDLIAKVNELVETPEDRYSKVDADLPTSTIEHTFADIESALKSGDLALGRGGFFLKNAEARVGEPCRFKISFEKGEISKVEGTGVVRWAGSSLDLAKRGIGVEFKYLPESTRSSVLHLIHDLNPVAYIPSSGSVQESKP